MIELKGFEAFISGLRAAKDLPDRLMRVKLQYSLQFVHTSVTKKTPVHTGQSLRNWVWTMGEPDSGSMRPALGSGDPGHTNTMPLGTEPLRPINQAAVDNSFAKISLRNPYQRFWFSNNSDTIRDLEYGLLPTAAKSRSPHGIVRVTMQNLLLALEGGAAK